MVWDLVLRASRDFVEYTYAYASEPTGLALLPLHRMSSGGGLPHLKVINFANQTRWNSTSRASRDMTRLLHSKDLSIQTKIPGLITYSTGASRPSRSVVVTEMLAPWGVYGYRGT